MRKVFCLALCLLAVSAMAAEPGVGVAEFSNDTAASWWYGGAGRELASMLSNELMATGKFRVVEREKLQKVLDEQDLAEAGRVKKSTGAKIGKLTGAKYLIFGTVSAFEHSTKGSGGGISFRGINVGGKKEDAYIAIDLRVIDTTTGDVEFVRTVEARSGGYAMAGGLYRGGFGGQLGKHEKTPVGKALRGVIIEAVDYLTCVMVDQDGCEKEYADKEKARRDKTKKAVKLD
jgi:curli biogenesis system outer membrane secretion channel CsgG